MQDIIQDLQQYCKMHSTLPDEKLNDIERQTHLQTLAPRMLSGHLQGSFLSLMSQLVAPIHVLEIGTFTGYSAICLAKGLQERGKVITIEYNEENAALAQENFNHSIYKDKIQLLQGDAKEIIPTLDVIFDLVFIDADKESYQIYFDLVFDKCSKGALIIADNVLWSGKVLDKNMDKKTAIIDTFNKNIFNNDQVENVIIPMRDGLNIIRKL
ncbi:MAG: O-methyltransferase [Saprospiraceae bacterium]|mgnify:CR=1 FL=1|jgi:predicted O-methyltransferase YrrM